MSAGLFQRIDTVFVPVRVLADAVAWYQAVLGWDVAWSNSCVASFKAGETAFTLLQNGYPGMDTPPDGHVFRPLSDVAFNFFAENIDAARQSLLDKGVAVGPMLNHGTMREFNFTDPDGNKFSVVSW